MERMTYRDSSIWARTEKDCRIFEDRDEFDNKCYSGSLINKLADYEDTGLTPEEIKYFKEAHSNIIKFVTDKKNVDRKYSCLLEVFDKQQKEIASLKEALKQALKRLEG